MEGRVATTKTSERLFFVGVNAAHELAPCDGSSDVTRADRSRSAIGEPQRAGLARMQITSIPSAVAEVWSGEIERGTLFLLVPVFGGCGAILYFAADTEPRLGAMTAGLTVLAVLRELARARPIARLLLLLGIAIIAGMLCAKLETIRAGTRMLGSEITTRITGRVVALAKDAKGGWRVTMDVVSTTQPALRYGPDRVVVSAKTLPLAVKIGDGLSGLVHLRPQSGPVRPGNYDFAFYNYYRGIGANGFLLGKANVVSVPAASRPAMLVAVANIRQQLTARILQNIKGEPGDIAASLITGQRDGISDDTNNAMRLSGLSHILSISGFHMALVAATIIGSLRAMLALLPGFSARLPVKKYSALIALIGSAFYLLISGADVAAQRSFIMLSVMLLAVTVDRAAISMRNLAIAALITIALSPHEILGPSFQMSYSATAALIAFYGWWSKRQNTRNPRSRRSFLTVLPIKAANYIAAIAMTSLVAGTVSSIFAAYHFNNTAPLGLIGNALALPVISTLVMPFAVLGLLAMPFDLDWLPFAIMGRGIEGVIAIAHMVASHSPNGNLGLMPQGTLILTSMGLILLLALSTRLRLCGVPFVLAAAIWMMRAHAPDIIIAEDGKLVALRTTDNDLAINRSSGSKFTLENWQEGYGTNAVVNPLKTGPSPDGMQFACTDNLCTARERGGLIIAYTHDPSRRLAACAEGDIVILAFAGTEVSCNDKNLLVISKRDLALHGSAELRLHEWSGEPFNFFRSADSDDVAQGPLLKANAEHVQRALSATVTYAVGPPVRPWNSYRTYSRTARNLADSRREQGPDGRNGAPLTRYKPQ